MTLASRFSRRTSRVSLRAVANPVEQLAVRAGLVQRVAGGVYTLPPLGVRVLRRVEGLVHERLEAIGGHEIRLPLLQARQLWESSARWEQFEPWMLTVGPDAAWCLSPTAEEAIVDSLAAGGRLSHRQLPTLLYLVQSRFRRNRGGRGLHRAQEYPMHEAYGFAGTAADVGQLAGAVATAYAGVFAACGVDTLVDPREAEPHSRRFYVASDAVNDKTLTRCGGCGALRAARDDGAAARSACDCGGRVTPIPVLQVAEVTPLGQRYTTRLGLRLAEAGGGESAPWMCAGGIGLYRLLLAAIDRHRHPSGLVWPLALAPFVVTVITVDDAHTRGHGARVHGDLEAAGVTVWWDDRPVSAGVKFADADLLGSPVRVIVGRRAAASGAADVERRPSGRTAAVPLDAVVPAVRRLLAAAP